MRKHTLIIVVLFAVAGCATKQNIAQIRVVDKPNYKNELFRYIEWENKNYGPAAFVSIGKRKNITAVMLIEGGTMEIGCAKAAATELEVPAYIDKPDGKVSLSLENAPLTKDACARKTFIPRPELSNGQYYVVRTKDGLAFEGSEPMSVEMFIRELLALRAEAIVVREATIADMFCLGTVADATGVRLLEVNKDGTFSGFGVNTGGSPIEACK